MRLRDFEYRFEETLKSHQLVYSVEVRQEPAMVPGDQWTYKTFRIETRHPEIEAPVLVSLYKHRRQGRFYRRAKTSCGGFVVPHQGRKVLHGGRNIWQQIRLYCSPL